MPLTLYVLFTSQTSKSQFGQTLAQSKITHSVTANTYINGGDVQRKNVVNNVDKSSLWAP